MRESPTFLSLFAGIGGFDLALERVGFRCLGQVENDAACQRVLAARFPGVPRWTDVRQFRVADGRLDTEGRAHSGGEWGALGESDASRVDLLVGGFPCQGVSIAGKRLGLADDRTALFWEICRVQDGLKAPWGLFENVPGLRTVSLGRDFETVLAALKERWPVVGWRTLDSRYFGVPQRRARVFFVCGPDEARVAAVLFEPEGGSGNPTAGGEAGPRVAASLTSGAHGAGVSAPGRRKEDDVNIVVAHALTGTMHKRRDEDTDTLVVAKSLKAGGNDRHDESHETYIIAATTTEASMLVTHALTGKGHDGSEDGTGRGTPLVIQDVRGKRDKRQNGIGISDGPVHTLDCTSQHGVAIAAGAHVPSLATAMLVRQLTPLEFERLQGFPDGWTCLCLPLDEWARDPDSAAERCACPDSPRYHQMGNAVTVTVVEWLGRRLMSARS